MRHQHEGFVIAGTGEIMIKRIISKEEEKERR